MFILLKKIVFGKKISTPVLATKKEKKSKNTQAEMCVGVAQTVGISKYSISILSTAINCRYW